MKSLNRINFFIMIISLAIFTQGCKDDMDESFDHQLLDESLENSLKEASNGIGKSHFVLPESNDFANIPQDPKNPLTAAKVDLGSKLYHETGMALFPKHPSGLETYSCASCHFAQAGFQAGRRQGISDGGQGFGLRGEGRDISPDYSLTNVDVQPIRTPTTLNTAYQQLMLWNGQFGGVGENLGTEANWTVGTPKETNTLGFEGLETQAIAGIDVHRMRCEEPMIKAAGYDLLFDEAFPDEAAATRYSKINGGLAIAAYERSLLANQAPFQRWLKGESGAMTKQQKEGAVLFFDRAQCYNCHTGPALSSMDFYSLGMADLEGVGIFGNPIDNATRLGRGGFTGNLADNFKFKVPQLYNMKDAPFYGHGGTFTSIEAVVRYKNKAIPEKNVGNSLDPKFAPLLLNEQEIAALTAFLSEALYDPNLMRYLPASLLSDNCFPNNDALSRADLGCN